MLPDQGPHDEAVLAAETRRLIDALRPFGVLHRAALERRTRAITWREGCFDRALHAAVASGKVRRLPLGFYACADSNDAAS